MEYCSLDETIVDVPGGAESPRRSNAASST